MAVCFINYLNREIGKKSDHGKTFFRESPKDPIQKRTFFALMSNQRSRIYLTKELQIPSIFIDIIQIIHSKRAT